MLSGLILAGGKSSRMGRDKAMLTLPDGRSLLQRQADILRAAGVDTVLASVRPESAKRLPGFTLVHDEVKDAGPMAGIAAGLGAAPAGLVVVLAVDMPAIQAAHLRQLVELSVDGKGVVPMQDGEIESLAAVYPSLLAKSAQAALQEGRFAVRAWVREQVAEGALVLWETPAEWAGVLRSWNTAADLPPLP
jgi:molybdopterin-guanine dinucleotide biosynthesis protein A